jgi:hypothetical protein
MIKRSTMWISGIVKRISFFLACTGVLAGCGLQSGPKLDATDMKFAGFYSDYLEQSGTIAAESPLQGAPAMTSRELDSLFSRHGIDQKTFDTKLSGYSKDPALWREVLLQVRKNLRGNR